MKKTFLKKGLRELKAHKFQYLFLVLILGMGIATYASFQNLMDSRWETFDTIYERSNFMDVDIQFQYGVYTSVTTAESLLGAEGIGQAITAAEYRLLFDAFIQHGEKDTSMTQGQVLSVYMDESGRLPSVNTPLFFGNETSFSSLQAYECYLEHNYAKINGILPGDTITITRGERQVELIVIAEVNIPEYFMVIRSGSFMPTPQTYGIVMVPHIVAQSLYAPELSYPVVNNIVATYGSGPQDQLNNVITSLFENTGIPVKIVEGDKNPARSFLKSDMEGDQGIITMFPVIIFIISGFGLIMALRQMIRAHRPQIGIFKALGIPQSTVLAYFGTMGLIVGVCSLATGILLTIPLNRAFESMLEQLMEFAVITYTSSMGYYVQAGALAIVLCMACTLLPAWNALRIRPVDAIQGREGRGMKKMGGLMGIVSSKHLPVSLRLTLRNMLRKPGRCGSSMLGIACSLGLLLGMTMLMFSLFDAITLAEDSAEWDYEVMFDGFVPQNMTVQWEEQYSGIRSINYGMLLPTEVSGPRGSKETIIYALADPESAFALDYQQGGMSKTGIVISPFLSANLGVAVGDTLTAKVPYYIPGNGYEYRSVALVVSGIQENHLGIYSFAGLEGMQDVTNIRGFMNIAYLDTGDAEIPGLEIELVTSEGVSSALYIANKERTLEQYFDLFIQVVYILAVVSAILATAIIYNLFMIAAAERRREYATMKTLGTSIGKIRKLIFEEAAIITAAGLGLGIAGGYALAEYMLRMGEQFELINVHIRFDYLGFGVGSAMIFTVVLAVSLLTVRQIASIDIASIIRERSI